eukprot:scaffold201602_cov23-Tisochrysis_lutea.AAC.1
MNCSQLAVVAVNTWRMRCSHNWNNTLGWWCSRETREHHLKVHAQPPVESPLQPPLKRQRRGGGYLPRPP